ncbi:MAG TPA: asparagine synthase (glutamine-hydrolyzing) [Pilimelia sp.]|nr:asparagine synthase (glutamine-hydrolyzing) [Pilimelia sp.]
MCRIYGFLHASVTDGEMATVGALQHHGGPDARGFVRRGRAGLGYTRLAIIDPAHGDQPYRLGDRITAVFNGEIYNHDALRATLRRQGYTFADRCDGSIIPALYELHGPDFVDLLDGMFTLAVLDERDRPTLLLATDDVGMKPLYYRWDAAARSLHFASELPALRGFSAVGAQRWEPGLDAYLATKTPFGERTLLSEVRVLPPATTLTCVAGGRPVVRNRGREPLAPCGDLPAAAAGLRERLAEEVRRLLAADCPVAVITSGGLDSSLVTRLAAAHQPVDSFHLTYRGTWPGDEREYARQVAAAAGTRHHEVEVDPTTFPDLVEAVVRHLGQPNADPITVSTYALFRAVREAGYRVALTGDAADEVFGGYDRMRTAVAADDWLPGYLDALAVLPQRDRYALYTPQYRAFVHGLAPVPDAGLALLRDGPGSVLDRILRFEQRYRLPSYHLRRVDHLSMASSVEVRLPFCQRTVWQWGRALADPLRIQGAEVKRALYAAAEGLLPASVLHRPKQPFTLPVQAMLAPGQPLWAYARDVLTAGRMRADGQLEPAAVEALFRAREERADDRVALTLWALLIYHVWLDQGAAAPDRHPAVGVPA